MRPDRWKKIESICQEAMKLEGQARTTYIENCCAGDQDLLDEVESLLAYEDFEWMSQPLVQVKSSLLFADVDETEQQLIGPYKLIREIGSGGMGHVYLAVRNDQQFERFVALKVIREGMISEDILSRFYSERQILATLNHPNIARLFDGGTTDEDLPWFAMEFVEGIPVTEYCERHQSTLDERLDLFLEICSAVQYAHQNLVIHRDLKPDNILITETGQPKLLDFGIAKLVEFEKTSDLKKYQSRIMTPEYASPEQVSKNEPITTVSDLYSLGVLLYELLAQDLPYHFDKRTPAIIQSTITQQKPEVPSQKKKALHRKGDLDSIILKALNKDPSERYTSVEQFAEDIRRYQHHLPVLAEKNSFFYRSGKFIRRNMIGVVSSAAVTLLIITFAFVTYFQSLTIQERAVEAENERDRAEQVSNFLIDLFSSVDPSSAKDQSLTAIELLQSGAERVENELSDQPELQSELYMVISDVYESLGMYNESFEMAEAALTLQRKLYGEIHQDIGRSLNSMGWLHRQMGNFEESESFFEMALMMRYQLYDDENLDIARTLNDLAVLKQSQGDFEATDSLLYRAIEIRKAALGERDESVGVALSNYAALKWRMNDLKSASELMEESLHILEETKGRENLQVAIAMTNLAAILMTQRRMEEAEKYYLDALDIRYQLVGENHPDVAYSLVHLGNLFQVKGNYDKAEEYLLKALKIRKDLLGDHHVTVGDTYRLIGLLYQKRADSDTAEEYYKKSLDLFQRIFPDGHVRTAQVYQYLGETHMSDEKFQLAMDNFEQSYNLFLHFYGEEDARTIKAMIYYGASLYDAGQHSEAEMILKQGKKLMNDSDLDSNNLKDILTARMK